MKTFLVLTQRLSNIWEFKILSFLYTHTAMIGLLLNTMDKGCKPSELPNQSRVYKKDTWEYTRFKNQEE
jgi:hypothetical protein